MDRSAEYCPVRRELEENLWALTSKLSKLTENLMKAMVQSDSEAFLHAKRSCQRTRDDLTDSRQRLADHRVKHKC